MPASFNDIIKAVQAAVQDFGEQIPGIQKSMLSAVQVELKELDLDSTGNIKTSVKNLKIIGQVKRQLLNLLQTDKYTEAVQNYLDAFETVTTLQHEYWTAIETTFKPGPLLAEIKSQALGDTVKVLTDNGIPAQISDALTQLLQTSVTSGGSYADLTDQLRAALTDQPENPGLLSKYARTYTVDALNTFARQYTRTVSDDLGYTWFAYQGSDIETTRPFCDAMTDFTFFSVDEIPRLLAAENLYYTNKKTGRRELVPIYEKTGLPAGLKAQTNPDNFQDLCGGWHCGHQIRPVPVSAVPLYIQNRDQIPGIQKKAKEGGPELDALGKRYAKEFGGTVTPINFKGYESITRKTKNELGGNYKELKDAVRNTVVVPYDKLESSAKIVDENPAVIRVKVQDGPKYFGYKGVITNVRLENGTIAEMQINSPGMIYAKVDRETALNVMTEKQYDAIAEATGLPGGLGHDYYEKIRVITEKDATPAQLALKDKLIAQSEKYYANFYGF